METPPDELFGELDFTVPDYSPRSRLYALEPLGWDTGDVESLSSYLIRLARAHRVSPRRLIRDVFVPASPEPNRMAYVGRRVDAANTIDGLGPYAAMFAEITEMLTTVSGIRYLTLLPLAKLLPRNGAGQLAKAPRWCSMCLIEKADDGTLYRPLIWSLALCQVCPRHRMQLQESCPQCGKRQPFLPRLPNLAHCDACGGPLVIRESPRTECADEESIWVATALADLVSRMSVLEPWLTRAQFMRVLRQGLDTWADGKAQRFCRILGVPPRMVKNWLLKDERPSLPQVLAIAHGLGILPATLMAGTIDPVVQTPSETLPAYPRLPREDLKPEEREGLKQLLEQIAQDADDTRSLAEVALQLGHTKACLKYWFPAASTFIRLKHLNAVRERGVAKRERDHCFLREVIRELIARGAYPSARRVTAALRPLGLMLLRPDLAAIYRAEVAALGCEARGLF